MFPSPLQGEGEKEVFLVPLSFARRGARGEVFMTSVNNLFKPKEANMPTIVDIAVSNEAFSTLVTAVSAASLVEALQSPGPFTVFAPTNDAFAKLPDGTITTLVQNIPQLARILTFHVVSGKYKKEDLIGVKSLISLEGTQIDINISEDCFEANNATVIAADIEADNGIIHVIDNVILMRPHWFYPIMESGKVGIA